MSQHTDVAATLIDIEAHLRQLGQWDNSPPTAEALASTQPFCIDTLTFPQWLQFVFLPRIYGLLAAQAALPPRCGIAPMAQEYYRGSGLACSGLLAALERVDEQLSVEES